MIVPRKVLLVLENDLKNRSDTLELLRMSLFANGWTEEGVSTCPLWKLAMKIWSVVMECLNVLIEERQRENSALGKRSASELDQSGEALPAAQRAFQDSQLEGVIKTPAVLQADAELRKATTAVLAGSAGILPAGSAASGKKPVPTWMDVDMSLLNKETESDGQLKFDQTSGAIKYDRTKKPTVDEWREYGLAHTLKLSGIQRTNFVELQQLYERLIVSHGFDAVYSFSLEVREKERVSQPGIQHKITSFMANHLCYDYGGDGGRVEYALHNIVSVERVSDLRCDFVRASLCKILTATL